MKSDGFIVVNNRKRRQRKKYKSNKNDYKLNDFEIECNFITTIDNINHKIDSCIEDLKTNYIQKVLLSFKRCFELKTIDKSIDNSIDIRFDSIICYGLGNFTTNKTSLYQLSLLLVMKQLFDCNNVYIYDPVFTQNETNILINKLSINLIEFNEESIHSIDSCDKRVLFFMPHCDKSLFNNLLWSNWDSNKLNNIFIFGNSFNNMLETIISQIDLQSFSYLLNITKFDNVLIECNIENDFIDKEVFNDLSIHAFNKENINEEKLKHYFKNQKPLYNDNESGDLII